MQGEGDKREWRRGGEQGEGREEEEGEGREKEAAEGDKKGKGGTHVHVGG